MDTLLNPWNLKINLTTSYSEDFASLTVSRVAWASWTGPQRSIECVHKHLPLQSM